MNTAILDRRFRIVPGTSSPSGTKSTLIRLFALDRLPADRRLVCHWHRNPEGGLACVWELDIGALDHPHGEF